jgi:hypothetical protein
MRESNEIVVLDSSKPAVVAKDQDYGVSAPILHCEQVNASARPGSGRVMAGR